MLDESADGRQRREGHPAGDPRRRPCGSAPARPRRCPTTSTCVVTSPGWRPDAPLLVAGGRARRPGLGRGRARLAAARPRGPRRLAGGHRHQRQDHDGADARRDPAAAGLRSIACGNVGLPIVEAVMTSPDGRRTTCSPSSSPASSCTTRRRWRASRPPCSTSPRTTSTGTRSLDDYAADKGRIYEGVERACVYNVADPVTEQLVREADVVEGARAIGFTLGTPGVGMLGVVDDVLADRAFVEQRQRQRRRARARSPTSPRRRRTSSPTRWPRPRWRAPTASRRPRCATGCGPSGPDGHRIAEVGGRRRRRATSTTPRPPTRTPPPSSLLGLRARRVGRRRAGQGRDVRRPGRAGPRPAARRRAARAGPGA